MSSSLAAWDPVTTSSTPQRRLPFTSSRVIAPRDSSHDTSPGAPSLRHSGDDNTLQGPTLRCGNRPQQQPLRYPDCGS